MSRPRGGHVALAIIVVILLGIFVPPFVNVNRYRVRIADALSGALGRPVTVEQISLRLLPQPGFDMQNVVVGDDPAFSAEPMLTAEEVTANLRISSLWRGRLEIARLSLKYPSLNLVFTPQGKLNLESLLWRASRTSAAPTTAKPQGRIRFPYIGVVGGRINIKFGLEKQVFALTDADFAIWSPWEDEWRMRLEAHPMRTDVAINDTGTLRAEGSFHRAELLANIPLNVRWSLERGQLGQITKLIYGRDRGWRGTVAISGTVTGVAGIPKLAFDADLQDFRRYDIVGGEPLRVRAQCSGDYQHGRKGEAGGYGSCRIPLGSGTVVLDTMLFRDHPAEFTLGARLVDVPADALAALAKHAKRDLPPDLTASGVVNGTFKVSRLATGASEFRGDGRASALVLKSSFLEKDLAIGNVDLVAITPSRNVKASAKAALVQPRLDLRPFPVSLGAASPVGADGWVSASGYEFTIQGDTEIARLLQAARALGVGVPHFGLYGNAKVNVAVVGDWKGFVQPTAVGTAQLRAVRAEVPGIASPVQIASAMATLSQNEIRLQSIVASVDTLNMTGTATVPRHCEGGESCVTRFDLQADELSVAKLNDLLNPRLKRRPWYRFFGRETENSILAAIQATGHIGAKRASVGAVTATRFSSDFALQNGKVQLHNLQADALGGHHAGEWQADFTGSTPKYAGQGTLSRASLAQVAALRKETWGTGTLSTRYKAQMQGWTGEELLRSLAGNGAIELNDSTLRHVALDGKGTPLHIRRYSAKSSLEKGTLRLEQSKLETVSGIYEVSGTASLDQALELQLTRADGTAFKLTGTLEKPQVATVPAPPAAEASLNR
ncbi:MAG TPA: AsmA family protein [Clostridia bacterium]|nr:AsmA family protein [Clostridia bacterium]